MKITIDENACTKCGTCVDNCPMEVLEMGDNGPIVANPDDCSGCRTCESNCESDAIKVEETE